MADTTTTDSAAAPPLTDLLSRFGVQYDKAPAPTPALLTFMRGLGMSFDTVEDTKRQAESRLKSRATDALGDIDRSAERTKSNTVADLARRGVLRGGEANTRFARQAEDVADRKSSVLRTQAEGMENANTIYNSTRDQYRQQALERVLGVETENATREASSAAQEQSYQRQLEENDRQYTRTKESQEAYLKGMEDLYARYGV